MRAREGGSCQHFILGIDQGTTSTRACLLGSDGNERFSARFSHQQFYPQPNWVEHDPNEIWRNTQAAIQKVKESAQVPIAGIALAHQGETVLLWDRKTGRPLSRAIVWQDTRTAEWSENLKKIPGLEKRLRGCTGLRCDPYFTAGKIRWLLDHTPESNVCAGTIDSWLIWNLTGGKVFATDTSTAARSLFFNVQTLQYEEELLDLFRIPKSILAEVRPSDAGFGVTLDGIPIVSSLVDQPAALFGEACLNKGEVKATYGTGCFVYFNLGEEFKPSQNGLLTTVAWQREGRATYALDGGIFAAGSAVEWLKEKLQFFSSVSEIDRLATPGGSVQCVPAFVGLAAPYWDRSARAAWVGMDFRTTRGDLIFSLLDGIAHRVAQVCRAMERDSGVPLTSITADGGLTQSEVLMQRQTDLLGIPVHVSQETESTVRGACYLAFRALGIWESDAILRAHKKIQKIVKPQISNSERAFSIDGFERTVKALRALA